MTNLQKVKCVTCRAGELSLNKGEIYLVHAQVPERQVKKVYGMNRPGRVFKFKNFIQGLRITNKIGSIGEKQDHQRLVITEWGKEAMGTPPISNDEGTVSRR